MTRAAQFLISLGLLLGIGFSVYIGFFTPHVTYQEKPAGTMRLFYESEDEEAYESLIAILQARGEIPKFAKVKKYEKGVATYKGLGVWDFRFWVDMPDGERKVFFNDYLDTDDHNWSKLVN